MLGDQYNETDDGVSPTKILIFSPYFKPASRSGGAALSVENFCRKFSSEYSISVITRNRDLKSRISFPGISSDRWIEVDGIRIFYASNALSVAVETFRMLSIRSSIDVIYMNSFFDLSFSFLPLIIRNLTGKSRIGAILAPRGELSPGALAQSAPKKKAFLAVTSATNLLRGIVWQATSDLEEMEILDVRQVSARRVVVAPNLARSRVRGSKQDPAPCSDGPTKIAFLSRISPKKNLDFALETLIGAKSNIVFDVYGPVEDLPYWDLCQSIATKLPENVIFSYLGPVAPQLVVETLRPYDLFFLPTLGENFGHAIVESWQAGVPVLISDRTPWRDLEGKGIGADFPLTQPDKFTRYIDGVALLNKETRMEQKRLAAFMGLSIENDEQTAVSNREMIQEAISGARLPQSRPSR